MKKLTMKAVLEAYDFNLPLKDALNDPGLSPDRRALAVAAMRQDLDDAYYSAMELLEAFRAMGREADAHLPADAYSEGEARIAHILAGDGDDYQRRLYYLLSERPITNAIADLEWLTTLAWNRGRMGRVLNETGARTPPVPWGEPPNGYEPTGCRPFGY